MKEHLKKVLIQIITILIILALRPSSLGEQSMWDCTNCSRQGNTGNYCGSCGYHAPWLEEAQLSCEKISNLIIPIFNSAEYILYQNIFYNSSGEKYLGKTVSKHGIFTTLHDEFSGANRYYIWGYEDHTKYRDWQWEIKVDDTRIIPNNGALITVDGIFEADEQALDGYWIVQPKFFIETDYTGKTVDIDMSTMSSSLEHVQIVNINTFPLQFEGKTIRAFGRILNRTTLQSPYVDGSWTFTFSSSQSIPSLGAYVTIQGTLINGICDNCIVIDEQKFDRQVDNI